MRRRSLATVLVFWFAIISGLAVFTLTRGDVPDLAGLWIGVVGGTAVGQFLAARDLRLWFLVMLLLAFAILCGPLTPLGASGKLFWMAMVPATVCGWMSLSDRGSLFAFWLPVVLWMLTILDLGHGALSFESGSAALLGGLAFLFVAFLYAREARRIDLWRTVAPTPIAPSSPAVVLREVPRLRVGVAGWSLVVSAAAFAICAWLAPRLWHVEALVPELYASAGATDDTAPMCCHDLYAIREQNKARVEEYFDLGRGHDDGASDPVSAGACVVCGPDNRPLGADHLATCDGDECGAVLGAGRYGLGDTTGDAVSVAPHGDVAAMPAMPMTPTLPPTTYEPAPAPTSAFAPTSEPPLPEPVGPEPVPAPEPAPAPPVPAIPELAATPAPAPAPAPASPPPAPAPVATAPIAHAPSAPQPASPPILTWVAIVLASGLAFQLFALGLRPVRRLLTLRHLRDPFWAETVDQRISNYWHLVLVGLRDAGWRTTSGEAPRELANRLDIAGVERAAAILERARHGVGIDAADLGEMRDASERAYRASRARASAFARLIGWFRRPLV